MPSTHKKVIVRKLDREAIHGYVAPNFISDGKVELLNTSGKMVLIELKDIKGIYFVRDFGDTESISRKTFSARPRMEGLWVRLKFRDNDVLEGMMPNDLAQSWGEGFFVNPPDTRSNTQRIFVPRPALESLLVLGVIGSARAQRRKAAVSEAQVAMFGE
jgi:hypothetical protein